MHSLLDHQLTRPHLIFEHLDNRFDGLIRIELRQLLLILLFCYIAEVEHIIDEVQEQFGLNSYLNVEFVGALLISHTLA